jgi:hypothetical protein
MSSPMVQKIMKKSSTSFFQEGPTATELNPGSFGMRTSRTPGMSTSAPMP